MNKMHEFYDRTLASLIYVNPELNIVVAVTSYFKPTIFDRVDFIEEYILSSLPE